MIRRVSSVGSRVSSGKGKGFINNRNITRIAVHPLLIKIHPQYSTSTGCPSSFSIINSSSCFPSYCAELEKASEKASIDFCLNCRHFNPSLSSGSPIFPFLASLSLNQIPRPSSPAIGPTTWGFLDDTVLKMVNDWTISGM